MRLEGDQLYHLKHAEIYREEGIFNSDFPWLPYSMIGKEGADLWYGFHIFLIPFTFFTDPVFGLKAAGFIIMLLLFAVFYLALARLKVEKVYIWPFLFMLSGYFTLFHLSTVRPHVLSLAFGVLVFSSAAAGSLLGVFGASFAVAFLHLNLFWSALLIVGVFATVKFFKREWGVRESVLLLAPALLGVFLGLILRPNPLGAAKLLYLQIIELALVKQKGYRLISGLSFILWAGLCRFCFGNF